MKNVKIITDSACDINKKDLEKYDIDVVPLNVVIGDESLKDGVEITPEEIYQRMRNGERFKTSQVNYKDFYDTFEKYAKIGRPFLYLAVSSGISGTYQTGKLALEQIKIDYPDTQAMCFDTKAISGGLGMVVESVGKYSMGNPTLDELYDYAKERASKIYHTFTVTDLNYLYEGGRLSKTSAIMGNMLKINPFMHVDGEGKLAVYSKQRGEKKILSAFGEYCKNHGGMAHPGAEFYITHADNLELAEKIRDELVRDYAPKHIAMLPISSVIGSHTGPGCVAFFFYDMRKEEDKTESDDEN